MNWQLIEFRALSNEALYNILKARVDVFVVEQECAYEEIDNLDQVAMHLFLTIDNQIVAYVRILPKETAYNEVSIGRVLVTKDYRGNGYAKQVMEKAIQFITDKWEESTIKIQAQEYLQKFYSDLGFVQISDVYLEDNIPHIDMIWSNNQKV